MTRFTDLMKENGIERIVWVPASDLLPRDEFHAWPFGAWLAEHCGIGATVEEAIENAGKLERKAA